MMWVVFFLAMGFFYSLRLRTAIFLSNVFVACVASSPTLYGAQVGLGHSPATILAQFLLFLFMLMFEIIKTMRDVPGDNAIGYRTLGTAFGASVILRLWFSLLALFAGAVFVGGMAVMARPVFYILMFAGVLTPLGYVALIITRRHDWDQSVRVLTASWLPGLLALGALR
jgi:4-hydroxybenzoate polyprenyltransferase